MKPKHNTMLAYLYTNEIAATFHHSLFDLFGYDLFHEGYIKSRVNVKAATMGIPDARNSICKTLLDDSDCEWLFFIDADMGFEMVLLDQLMAVADAKDRPIVGGLAFVNRELGPDGRNGMRTFPSPTIMDYWQHKDGIFRFTARTHYPINSMTRVGATGAAVLLIHRSVVQTMREKFGDEWFSRLRDGAGAELGEDISFCDRCRLLDLPVYVHTGIRTTHFKQIWLGEDHFWDAFLAPPAEERVDVIIPCLHRPQNVRTLMVSLRASTGLANAWYICDPEDEEQQEEVYKYGGMVLEHPGSFSQKVNWAYREIRRETTTWEAQERAPWILLAGDDVRFRPGWLDHAQDVARRYGSKVVGTNDLANQRVMRGEHATHPMIRKDYIDELGASWDGPGIVCHEGYHHWFVDDEIVTVAKSRKTFQSAHGSEVEHLHPIVGAAPMDEIYEKGQSHTKEDGELFEQRLRMSLGAAPNRAQRRAKPKLQLVK